MCLNWFHDGFDDDNGNGSSRSGRLFPLVEGNALQRMDTVFRYAFLIIERTIGIFRGEEEDSSFNNDTAVTDDYDVCIDIYTGPLRKKKYYRPAID